MDPHLYKGHVGVCETTVSTINSWMASSGCAAEEGTLLSQAIRTIGLGGRENVLGGSETLGHKSFLTGSSTEPFSCWKRFLHATIFLLGLGRCSGNKG